MNEQVDYEIKEYVKAWFDILFKWLCDGNYKDEEEHFEG